MPRLAALSLLLAIVPITPRSIGAQQPGATEALVERIDGQLRRGWPADEPGAVVVAMQKGEVAFRRAYGKASLELDLDVAPEMAFCLASVTKPFTATATMQLVQDGALKLGESASARLDGIEFDERITIEHLLSHTSGLPDFFELDGFGSDHLHAAIRPEELCAAAHGCKLQFEPGTRYAYSNLGYAVLGRIVEVASGKSWEEFLVERVFGPAGMKHTGYGGHGRVIAGAVSNYTKTDGAWRRAAPLSYTRGFGLGGLFSTVDDLVAFDAALRSGKLMTMDTLERMHQLPKLPAGQETNYGLGWVVTERNGHRLMHHSGGINGWRTHIVRIPASEIFVAVLSNRGEERSPVVAAGMTIALRLADLKDGER